MTLTHYATGISPVVFGSGYTHLVNVDSWLCHGHFLYANFVYILLDKPDLFRKSSITKNLKK